MMSDRSGLGMVVDVAFLLALLLMAGLLIRREGRAHNDQRPIVLEGRRLGSIEVVDSGGQRLGIDAARERQPHLLFVFRSDCPACARQREGWGELAELARSAGVEVLALTGEPLTPSIRAYLEDAGVPVLSIKDPSPLIELGVLSVPTTILADETGVIRFGSVGIIGNIEMAARAIEHARARSQTPEGVGQ